MNIAELIEKRQVQWQQLEEYLVRFKSLRLRREMTAEDIAKFTALHRAACADLALCRSYRIPPGTIRYLNDLVGRSHNQLYRDQTVTFWTWFRLLLHDAPYHIFSDKTFWAAMLIFWGPFIICMILASQSNEFAVTIVGQETLESVEMSFNRSFDEMDVGDRSGMVGFYIWNNAGIGLTCFAMGIIVMIPGLLITLFNAIQLGTIFGYMIHSSSAPMFFEFVTAHGPFELTAIVMASGAGLRLGFSIIHTRGLTRSDSLRLTASETISNISVATILFGLAALIEAFVSPSPMLIFKSFGIEAPVVKTTIAIVCTFLLIYYIVVLGGLQTLKKRNERIRKGTVEPSIPLY